MTDPVSIVCAVLGGFIVLFGLISGFVKQRLYVSEAFIATAIGVAFGPLGANWFTPDSWGNEENITREFSRLVIAIQVMAAGVALPKAYLRKEIQSLLILLIPGMIWMWLSSSLLVWWLIPGLNFLEAMMIASCFTPTDPVLASSIVQGHFAEQHVPFHIRNIILAESGANDGLGYPFLFLAVYLLQMPTGQAIGKWFYWILAFQILLSIVIGFVVGFIARKALKFAEQKQLIDKESFLVFAVALALFLTGVVSIIGSDDLLACFIAGNSFTWDDWFRVETENAHMAEPWSEFVDSALSLSLWRLFVLAILVLLLRRLPFVLAAYKFTPAIHSFREALFTGWFGPIGVGALFYYTVAIEQFTEDGPDSHARSVVKPIVYFMILASIVVHGNTVPLFYMGSYATRTLTRTSFSSSAGNSVSRLPKLVFGQDVFLRSNRGNRSTTATRDGVPITPDTTSVPEVTRAPKQTAITIITPENVRNKPSMTYSESAPNISSSTMRNNNSPDTSPIRRDSEQANREPPQSVTIPDSPGRASIESLEDII
ncbi:Sodium/hydrogen exchanger family-domain-containing protein [Umbelopsis sp. PMI_123]|nr:Sodium/hydrogen exchanger family-domain-containing protein [Umbelopsis sp. PMI_123]